MKSKYYIYLSILVLSLLFLTVACSQDSNDSDSNGSTDDSFTMKIAHVSSPEDVRQKGAESIKESVEEQTEGEVEIYPASQLGDNDEIIQGMQTGNIEMVLLPPASMGSFQPLLSMLDIPYISPTDQDNLLEFFESDAIKNLYETTEEKDIKILGTWHLGYKIFTANKPLKEVSDFKGEKFRTQNSDIIIKTMEELGATAVNLPFSEVYSAMQSKTIDGQGGNDISTVYDMKFHEVQSDFTMTNHGTNSLLVMVSKDWFDGLSEDNQQVIMDSVKDGSQLVTEEAEKKAEKVKEEIEGTFVDFNEVTPEQIESLQKETKGVEDLYLEKNSDNNAKELLDSVKQAKKELEK